MSKNITIAQYVKSDIVREQAEKLLGKRAGQFIASVSSLVNSSPLLAECEPKTVLSACMTAASLDLPISQSLGFAYIIPYKKQAQFQMGYKGYIQLAQRSGQVTRINATDVREGEIVSIDRLSGDITFNWIQNADDRNNAKVIGYVAYFRLVNGYEKMLYMTSEELQAHGKKFSQTARKNYGLWVDEFDAMAKKTVLKLLLSKDAPLSTDMVRAIEADQAVIDGEKTTYADNKPETTKEKVAENERSFILEHIADSKTIEELRQVDDAMKQYIEDAEVCKAYNDRATELELGIDTNN